MNRNFGDYLPTPPDQPLPELSVETVASIASIDNDTDVIVPVPHDDILRLRQPMVNFQSDMQVNVSNSKSAVEEWLDDAMSVIKDDLSATSNDNNSYSFPIYEPISDEENEKPLSNNDKNIDFEQPIDLSTCSIQTRLNDIENDSSKKLREGGIFNKNVRDSVAKSYSSNNTNSMTDTNLCLGASSNSMETENSTGSLNVADSSLKIETTSKPYSYKPNIFRNNKPGVSLLQSLLNEGLGLSASQPMSVTTCNVTQSSPHLPKQSSNKSGPQLPKQSPNKSGLQLPNQSPTQSGAQLPKQSPTQSGIQLHEKSPTQLPDQSLAHSNSQLTEESPIQYLKKLLLNSQTDYHTKILNLPSADSSTKPPSKQLTQNLEDFNSNIPMQLTQSSRQNPMPTLINTLTQPYKTKPTQSVTQQPMHLPHENHARRSPDNFLEQLSGPLPMYQQPKTSPKKYHDNQKRQSSSTYSFEQLLEQSPSHQNLDQQPRQSPTEYFSRLPMQPYQQHTDLRHTSHQYPDRSTSLQSTTYTYQNLLQSQKNMHMQLQANVEQNMQTNMQADIQNNMQPNLRSNMQLNLGSNIQLNLGSNIQIKLGSNVPTNVQTHLPSNMAPYLQPKRQSNVQQHVQSNLVQQFRPNMQPNVQNNSQQNVHYNVQVMVPTNMQSGMQNNMQLGIQNNMQPTIQNNIQPTMQNNMQQNLQSISGPYLRANLQPHLYPNSHIHSTKKVNPYSQPRYYTYSQTHTRKSIHQVEEQYQTSDTCIRPQAPNMAFPDQIPLTTHSRLRTYSFSPPRQSRSVSRSSLVYTEQINCRKRSISTPTLTEPEDAARMDPSQALYRST